MKMGTRRTSIFARCAALGCILTRVAAASPEDSFRVTVREIPAYSIAYLEHTGPYWTVGETLRTVYDRTPANDRPRQFFARFASSPLASRSAALRAEVGYPIPSDAGADASVAGTTQGLRISERPLELAACVEFEPGEAPRAQDFSQLRQWIAQNGYRSVGPVTEVYTFSTDDEPSVPRVELQMTIRPANDPREESAARPGAVAVEVADTAAGSESSPASGAFSQDQASSIAANHDPAREIPPLAPIHPLIVQTEPPLQVRAAIALPESETNPAARTVGTPNVEPSNESPTTEPSPEASAAVPVDPPECVALAEEFLADIQRVSPDTRAWLGAALLRIDAIGRALRAGSTMPGSVATCSSAISRASQRSVSDPATPALTASPVPARVKTRIGEQKAVLRELDVLMMRLASRPAETGRAGEDLAALFERIRTILDSERSASTPVDSAPR